ncbi:MAG: EF-P lysine aminoacylase EpmA, partial [Pseudomonadota bacterium]
TSPELAIKRLLASGLGDAYELGPVFRQGEAGRRHNPEFTLLEWYRVGWDEHRLMDEVAELLAALLGDLGAPRRAAYGDWLQRATGLDVHDATTRDLRAALSEFTELSDAPLTRDDLLDLLFAYAVAPTFPTSALTFVHDYPASQAVLAQLSEDDPRVARRFEVYLGELELGNGFYELRDADEQRARFERENDLRRALGKPTCAPDEAFLAALAAGLPECAGVAIGVDRIVMLATGVDDIAATLAFGFDVA